MDERELNAAHARERAQIRAWQAEMAEDPSGWLDALRRQYVDAPWPAELSSDGSREVQARTQGSQLD